MVPQRRNGSNTTALKSTITRATDLASLRSMYCPEGEERVGNASSLTIGLADHGIAAAPPEAPASSVGSQKPRRCPSKSKIVTKCSRKTPPSTQSSICSSAICSRRPPSNCGSGIGKPSLSLEEERPHFVLFCTNLSPSQTRDCSQTLPSGCGVMMRSTRSPPPPGAGMPGMPGIGKKGGAWSWPQGEACWPPSPLTGPNGGIGKGNGGIGHGAPDASSPEGEGGGPPQGCDPPRMPSRPPRMSSGEPACSGMACCGRAMTFSWTCSKHNCPPSTACTFWKSFSTGKENSRPPSCTRKGSMPGASTTLQSQTTRPPALGSTPHCALKTSSGNTERTNAP
mmetsp:Transcript_41470/g.119569  ORF Transcript_41470/g.119569 Transcript_41470/m.119569 type:complete len:339 (+) Transcript_41470:246-1262(+)